MIDLLTTGRCFGFNANADAGASRLFCRSRFSLLSRSARLFALADASRLNGRESMDE